MHQELPLVASHSECQALHSHSAELPVLEFHCQRKGPQVLQEQVQPKSASALIAVLGRKNSWTRSSLAESSSYFRPCHPGTEPLAFNVKIAAESPPPLPNRPYHDCKRLPDTTRTDISLHFDMPTVYATTLSILSHCPFKIPLGGCDIPILLPL